MSGSKTLNEVYSVMYAERALRTLRSWRAMENDLHNFIMTRSEKDRMVVTVEVSL